MSCMMSSMNEQVGKWGWLGGGGRLGSRANISLEFCHNGVTHPVLVIFTFAVTK